MTTGVSVLAALAREMGPLADELEPLGAALVDGDEEAAAQYLAVLERLSNVVELLDLPALGDFTAHLLGNIPGQLGSGQGGDLVAGWPRQFEAFLQAPEDAGAHAALVACMCDQRWPEPMQPEQAEQVLEQLQAADATDIEQPRQPREFTAADAELQWLPDLTTEMRGAFEHEAPRYAATLNHHLARLSRDNQDIREDLRQARRMAHTLKGSATLVGARAVVNLTHLLEDLLECLQESPELADSALIDDLQGAGDNLEEMIEALLGLGPAPAGIPALLENMDQWVVRLASEPAAAAAPESPAAAERPAQPATAAAAATPEPGINLPLRAVDEMLRTVGDLLVQFGHSQTRLRDAVERSNQLESHLFAMQQTVLELDTLIDLRATPAVEAGGRGRWADFDLLEVDQYNQLHSLGRRVAESALDAREMARELHERLLGMQNLMRQQQRTGREVNNAVMAARLVRVSTQENRWQRTVRQTCRVTGKQAELTLQGGDLAIDTDILNALVEPLLHLLRNAVDHGIEPPEQRLHAGKPETGQIRLQFRQDGSRILVELSDDGRGLDEQAITDRARVLKLFSEDHLPDAAEVQHAVLASGFSTRDEVTETSGRGIGLDVVRSAVQNIGGTLALRSEPGQGLSVKLVLPQSLTSTHLLFVRVGDAQFALPSLRIDQILFSDAGVVETIGGRRIFRFGRDECPIHRLADLLGLPGEASLDENAPRPLVLMHTDEGRIALLIDQVIESREAVVKSLHVHFPGLRGASGACILADGDVAIVLDLAEVELAASPESRRVARRISEIAMPDAKRARVLIADDSLSARRSLARIIEDLGYMPETAVDGVDALEHIEAHAPDVLLLDLEMPRMNGLELTAHLRSRPETADLPVIMITSRSTAKHRKQADRVGVSRYLTKPFDDQELADLLGHAVAGRLSRVTA